MRTQNRTAGRISGTSKRRKQRGTFSFSWKNRPLESIFAILIVISLVLVLVSYHYLFHFSSSDASTDSNNDKGSNAAKQPNMPQHHDNKPKQRKSTSIDSKTTTLQNYEYWRDVAVQLAQLSAPDLLRELENRDPFQVRSFERQLLDEETKQGRILPLEEVRKLFPCPTNLADTNSHRITIPDQRNMTRSDEFRDGKDFLFFQHLRKAGGTNFCTLAEHNLPRDTLPRYYCMPDMHWPKTPGAGYLHSWSNAEIIQHFEEEHFRVAGNEWDAFDPSRHWELPAVFATSFRRPLDRALSQFRFECLENRGCKMRNVTLWWQRRRDLANVYVRTFADPPTLAGLVQHTYRGTTASDSRKRGELVGKALDTVAKFHLVTVMEWLAYAGPLVTQVLGFQDTSYLTERVRPHIQQAPRHDGPNANVLGARGVIQQTSNNKQQDGKDKTSNNWKSKEMLVPELHVEMSQDLALDEILTDAARRIFLEHLVCGETK